ncbi:MAG: family 78 glycoside hydrolase catalytic domain, partial [Planctomycetota bacterium]
MKYTASPKKLVETEIQPVETRLLNDGTLFVDFGRAAYGTIRLRLPANARPLVVHLGEKLTEAGRIDRDPPGTVRYRRIEQGTDTSNDTCRIVIPPDERNTGERAI